MCLHHMESVIEKAIVDDMCNELRLFELFLLALHAPHPCEEIYCTVNCYCNVDARFMGVIIEILGLCLLQQG